MSSASPEDPAELFGEEDDLFGDEDEAQSEQQRALSDQELDSGDDEDRNDRSLDHGHGSTQQVGLEDREARILDAAFPRHAIPKPTDREVCITRY